MPPAAADADLHERPVRTWNGEQAVERALSKCKEGPRRLRLYDLKASLLDKKGDAAGRKATLEEAVKYAKKLPKSQISQRSIDALEAQLPK